MKKKVLVVDLDKTLFSINTFHHFIKYLAFKSIKEVNVLFLFKLGLALSSRLFLTHAKMKFYVLNIIKDRTDIDFNHFVNTISTKKRELSILQDSSFDIKILATAAPSCYANIIAKNNSFHICLGTDFSNSTFKSSFENSKITKKENVMDYLSKSNINHIDVMVTDSIDDMPLIKLAKRNVIVNPSENFKKQLKQKSISFEVIQQRS
ncbi:hypothetical protein BFR04_07540 [Gaetbulibacter sp. 4G1]|nr:hypothetical protein [Gaetbulibacter sp. 4G1]PIA78075.1 hypothetical protein BFR04_07540 [Gaetbulibacter sp. 4G1]